MNFNISSPINLSAFFPLIQHDTQFMVNMFFFLFSSATIGISHPDIVVETNTLSSVPPPDITYTLSIPESTIKNGLLSALQLEAIIYACQVHIPAHNTWSTFNGVTLEAYWSSFVPYAPSATWGDPPEQAEGRLSDRRWGRGRKGTHCGRNHPGELP